MDNTRMMDMIGMCFASFYFFAGVYNCLQASFSFENTCDTMRSMEIIAGQLFLIFFGLAASFMCYAKDTDFGAWFFFLYTWVGKGIFFIVMGFFLDMQFCPGTHDKCLDFSKDVFHPIGVIVSWGSVIFGVVILIKSLAGHFVDRCSYTVSGSREINLVEISAAVASVGMILIGVMQVQYLLDNKRVTWVSWFQHGSIIVILFVFGVGSLLAALRSSAFFQTFFRFLASGWQRGVFYFLMGCWTLPYGYDGCDRWGKREWELYTWVIVLCSVVSIVVGLVFVVLGCGSR